MTISTKTSADKSRTYYYIEFGKAAGQRTATGIYTINNPKTQQERSFNKEQLAIINTKRMELELEISSTGSGYIPSHKFKHNFLDFYSEYVHANKKYANRHLENSLSAFKTFLGRDRIGPSDITHNLCERFRSYLLEHYNGETPSGYFSRFKKVLKSATREGYFKVSPAEDLKSKAKESKVKDILGIEDYDTLKKTPCLNPEVARAAMFSLYTALRWVDIKKLKWESIRGGFAMVQQSKTSKPVVIPLHPHAIILLGEHQAEGLVFDLPTQDGANKALGQWIKSAGIEKHITWHSLRHTVSVILQDKGVEIQTVAGMLGHTSTQHVSKTYKRYRNEKAAEAIKLLPI